MRILVIRLGALGDVVLSFAPFAAIRAAYPGAEITLLTTAPFQALAEASPWFDRVIRDARSSWLDPVGLWRQHRTLSGFDRVIDLQTSCRSSRYYWMAGRPCWSGIANGCAFQHDNPQRDAMHTVARQRDQLLRAGIAPVDLPELDWLTAAGPRIDGRYALLVPGAAPHRPAKRWSAERFGALAVDLAAHGLQPVVVGTSADAKAAETITRACPQALDMTGKTDLLELAGLAARAAIAIGNDTGPMHLAAAMGCRSIVLFSAESDPRLTAPVGRSPGQVSVVAVPDLANLQVERVKALLDGEKPPN